MKSALMFVLFMVITIILTGIITQISGNQKLGLIAFVTLFLITITGFIKLSVKFSISESGLDRRGLVSVNMGSMIIYSLFAIAAIFFGAKLANTLLLIIFPISLTLYWITTLLLSIMASYLLAISIFNIIAIYRYGQGLGISKLKLLLSIPFGLNLIKNLAYVSKTDKKSSVSFSFKCKNFNNLINWILRNKLNGITLLVILAGISLWIAPLYLTVISILTLILFFVIFATMGEKKILGNVSGFFSNIAVIINIAVILSSGYFLAKAVQQRMNTRFAMQAEIQMQQETEQIKPIKTESTKPGVVKPAKPVVKPTKVTIKTSK